MAAMFANMLSALAKLTNNGVATFTFWGIWGETECPEELLK